MNINKIKILLFLLLLAGFAQAQVNEREYKAAFIERFTRFIEWPSDFEEDNFTIVVIGKTPLVNAITELFENLEIKDQTVEIIYTNNINDLTQANLVFIASSEKKRVPEIIATTKKLPILTISDTKGFAASGVHINMYNSRGYIRYEINQEAVIESNLKVSSLLLNTAKIVKSDE